MKKLLTFAAAALWMTPAAWAQRPNQKPDPTPEQQILRALTGNHHENDRINAEGRVRRVTRERDGYRVELDNDHDTYWVPQSRLSGRNLSIGVTIRLGGVFRGGVVFVDDFSWRDQRDSVIRGNVTRVNNRLGFIVVRQRDGDTVRVDVRDADLRGIRRGDAIAIWGDWTRDGVFHADRIDRTRGPW